MDRQDFLAIYHKVKHLIAERDNNQFAIIEGSLVTLEAFYNFILEMKDDEYTLTTDESTGEEEYYDIEIEDFRDLTHKPDTLYVAFWRADSYTSQLDFYNNEVEIGCGDLQRSKITEYYLADSKGKLHEIYVKDWKVDS